VVEGSYFRRRQRCGCCIASQLVVMPNNWKQVLTIACAIAGMELLDEWLAVYIPGIVLRVALLFGLAFIAGSLWQWYPATSEQSARKAIEAGDAERIAVLDMQAISEVTIALEHLRSVRLLLEISDIHRQPLPRAVPLNLELVIKHLDNARQRFGSRELTAASFSPDTAQGDC
jgi:hypothetical protein